jgi:minor extracellular serine protease Vpr
VQHFRRICLSFLCFAALALAQIVPGRYVVELSGSPLGADARTKATAALARRATAIRIEQARARALILQHRGQVLSSVTGVMNALIVAIPDQNAAALASLPGVKKVYPVRQYTLNLDHALPLHHVPNAWARIGGKDKAGAGVKIAMLDTGTSPDHPGFEDPNLKPPPGFPLASSSTNLALTNNKIIVARSYEDIYQETEPDDARDRNGHGTATSMAAAGVTNTAPFATITGVAPAAWIGDYKIVAGNSGTATDDVILKALDDALSDGMDVVNFSFGDAFIGIDPFLDTAFDRMSQYGVNVVVAAGNNGPGLNTMSDPAWLPSVITAGAMQSDRAFRGSVTLSGAAYQAYPSNGPVPGPITSTVFDVSSVDSSSLLCSPIPADSATGQIALVLRGTCTFETKVNNAQAAGAIAVILYNNVAGGLNPSIGTATLPTVLLTNADGLALKAAIAGQPSTAVTVIFNGDAITQDPNVLASFTSKGPNFDYTIKPDLVAVGTDVYTATQRADPTGEFYDKSGYAVVNGTSLSAPIIAGAVAVLRGTRPGLTAPQYRSLIINSSEALIHDDGEVERVQQSGAGLLDLDAALRSNIAAFPTSLTYGVGDGNLGGADTFDFNQVTLTNVGNATDTFHIYASAFDYAPPLQFSAIPFDENPTDTLDVTLDPGQSKTVYAFWTASGLVAGEYQGDIIVQDASSSALIPYWYGVPTGIPADQFFLLTPPPEAPAGSTQIAYVRVIDRIGYAIVNRLGLQFQGAAATTGASVTLNPQLYFPNIWELDFKLASQPGVNTYLVQFGKAPPAVFTITGD